MEASISRLSTSHRHTHLPTLSQSHRHQFQNPFFIYHCYSNTQIYSLLLWKHPPLTLSLWQKHPHLNLLPPPLALLLIIWIYPPFLCESTAAPPTIVSCGGALQPHLPLWVEGVLVDWQFKMAAAAREEAGKKDRV